MIYVIIYPERVIKYKESKRGTHILRGPINIRTLNIFELVRAGEKLM